MNLGDSEEEARFRVTLRNWLLEHAPEQHDLTDLDSRHAFLLEWWRTLHGGSWLGLSWPKDVGGQGLGPLEEAIFQEEVARAGAPDPPMFGYIGRPILLFGSPEQRFRYLPPMLACEELWCQGFSEPSAGSDLSGLRTKADLKGDHFILNGHKIWTSYGQYADFCLVLARTDATAAKHDGISALIVDLTAPGIDIRPIVTAKGDAEFCEVFYDDVTVPAENLVGSLGDGWSIAMTTLAFERGPVDIGYQAKYELLLRHLVDEMRTRGLTNDPLARQRLAEAAAGVEVLKLHVLRSLTARVGGTAPGPEGSIDKLAMAATEQRLMDAALQILGAPAILGSGHDWFGDYLYSRAATIYGGTAQIQKNILARRMLHLPSS